jgi:hypothetical protein
MTLSLRRSIDIRIAKNDMFMQILTECLQIDILESGKFVLTWAGATN